MADGVRVRTVSEVMSHPALTASPDESLEAVAKRMAEHGIGSIVVVDGEAPTGILTERDLLRFVAGGGDPSQAKVSEWMTADPVTLGPQEPVVQAFERIGQGRFRHIPVVESGRLVGIVSMRDLFRVASIEPMQHPGQMEAPRGLAGVIVAETAIGDVRGEEGFYHYRQYSATDLARERTLEDVWCLLFDGELPDLSRREEFMAEVAPLRQVPDEVMKVLPDVVASGGRFVPLDALRSAVSMVADALDFKPTLDITPEQIRRDALQICAVTPTLIAALWRLHKGLEPVPPRDDLGYAANYLWMLGGEVPDPEIARAIEQYQITTVDHGFNASTFTARVICSTGADVGAAVVGAIGALSGPLHGGAPSRALDMLDEIGDPSRAEDWVRSKVLAGERIMGFGHRVYKTEDPRSRLLREVAERLGGDRVELAKEVERVVVKVLEELKPGRRLYTNVEYYAGVVMERCGLPPELFTPTFASSRVIGWCAHILEQVVDNRIIRPSAKYVGPPPPAEIPPLA
ncbi:MAG: hypothetical protein KatS3mg008_1593 [Acidimicrobiales bacterium]|nr:MAG: hypothetical protein KatS3mg008_1593 [Acidimicrobiales bacterium]